MSSKNYKVVAVGTGDPNRLPVWVGYLKTYLEEKSALKGRVSMPVLMPPVARSFDKLYGAIVAENPDMVTFTPHEDWNTDSLLALCRQLKSWNGELPIVICAENPRNRMQLEAAEKSRSIDYIIHGEAELPLEKLVEYCAGWSDSLPEYGNLICLTTTGKRPGAKR